MWRNEKINLEKIVKCLVEDLKKKGSIVVAFSGGVDSSVVAALAYKALAKNTLAVTVDSPLLPSEELPNAKKVAKKIGIKHLIVRLDELKIPEFVKNPPNRCYLCKKYRFSFLKKFLEEKGFNFNVIVDGTSLSDLGEYRPGLLALREEGVYSPLLEHKIGKELTRKIAKFLGLPVYNKPSSACLASRFPYWTELTLEKLRRVDKAEKYLRDRFQIKVVRVRDHNGLARIEIGKEEFKLLLKRNAMNNIVGRLKKLGFKFITLDLEGYRFGSFDEELKTM